MPWGRVDDTLYDHPKLDRLPEEHVWPDRLAAVGLNYIAVSWCNRHLTDGVVPEERVAKLGGSIELAETLVKAGLWERVRGGGFRIHDFLQYNDSRDAVMARRERETARKAAWRATRHGGSPSGTDDGTTSGTDAGTNHGTNGRVRAADSANVSRPESRRLSRPESRDSSRANPDPTRPDPNPTRPIDSLGRDSAGARDSRADVQALLDRGWPKVTRAQRKLLDEVLTRHDVTGPAFAAEVIRATPAERDPLAEVLAADRRWQEAQRKAADAADAEWQRTKADERATAGDAMARIGEHVDAVPWMPVPDPEPVR